MAKPVLRILLRCLAAGIVVLGVYVAFAVFSSRNGENLSNPTKENLPPPPPGVLAFNNPDELVTGKPDMGQVVWISGAVFRGTRLPEQLFILPYKPGRSYAFCNFAPDLQLIGGQHGTIQAEFQEFLPSEATGAEPGTYLVELKNCSRVLPP